MSKLVVLAIVLLGLIKFHYAAVIQPNKKCGTIVCKSDEHCSTFTNQCHHCSEVCGEETHNYDAHICKTECQDYQNRHLYVSRAQYDAEIGKLQLGQNIILILVLILLILFVAVHGLRFIRWCKSRDFKVSWSCLKFKSKPKAPKQTIPVGVTHENPNTQSPKLPRPKLQINGGASTIYAASGVASTVNTVSTPLSRRVPTEDTTPEFTYDNGGLAITPESETRNHTGPETTF